ncbi:hypothetical protein KIW84_023225 [Lathyrus oleraceus]|uniref:Uncharacterized protein n=1 Tax=Pisum sativum TaxID=3888 RepID=A0A9D4YGX1_PEA|nr:hypothetical protein KIW84_023225 [Pisum sativum]
MGMHATKDRVESETSTVYSISLYESTITTRDEPWFGELKFALGVKKRTPSYCARSYTEAARVSKELPLKGGTGYVEGYPGGSRLTRIPGRVLPVQPGLAMEQACELGTPFRYLHRLDKEFQLMGRFFNWVIFLVN